MFEMKRLAGLNRQKVRQNPNSDGLYRYTKPARQIANQLS